MVAFKRLFMLNLLTLLLIPPTGAQDSKPARKVKVAGVVSVYHYNSHADMIVGRTLRGYSLLDKDPRPSLQLMSLFTDPCNFIKQLY